MAEVQAFEKVVRSYLKNRTIESTETGQKHYSGHIDSEEEYVNFISDLKATGFSFSIRTSGKNQSRRLFSSMVYPKNPVLNIPFLGVPFQIVKNSYLTCSHGSQYYKTYLPEDNDTVPIKRRPKRSSKKFGCAAFLSMKCIRMYEGYKLEKYSQGNRQKAKVMEKLKQKLFTKASPPSKLRYLIVMSQAEDHNHSVVTTNLNQTIHPKIKAEIHKLVEQGVSSVQTMKSLLQTCVEEMFKNSNTSPPDKLNRRFYPKDRVINGYMHRAFLKLMKSPADEEALETAIKTWKTDSPDDHFFFRPCNIESNKPEEMQNDANISATSMLFCQQTKSQQDFLIQHGYNVCVLDAAYVTARLNLPLFHICVKVGSSYKTVGSFIIPFATSTAISDALSVFSQWNPNWHPRYFLTSFSAEEISAIERSFPESSVYICSFHRDQLWGRWFNRVGNAPHGVEGHIRTLWILLASANSETEFYAKLEAMYMDPVLQECGMAKNFFTSKMLPYAHRWINAFMNDDFVLQNCLSGLVAKRPHPLSHKHLLRLPDQTLTGIASVVIAASSVQDFQVDSELLIDETVEMSNWESEFQMADEEIETSNSYLTQNIASSGLELSDTSYPTLSPNLDQSSLNQLASEHSYFMIAPESTSTTGFGHDAHLVTPSKIQVGRSCYEHETKKKKVKKGKIISKAFENNLRRTLQNVEPHRVLVPCNDVLMTSSQERSLLEDIRSQVCEKLSRLTELALLSENVGNLKESLNLLNGVEKKITTVEKISSSRYPIYVPNFCVKNRVVLQHVSSSKPVVIRKYAK